MTKTFDSMLGSTAYIIGDVAAVKLGPRQWIRAVRNGEGWYVPGCRTLGYGYGSTPHLAVYNAMCHRGIADHSVRDSRKDVLA
jgi:hypothetical protein